MTVPSPTDFSSRSCWALAALCALGAIGAVLPVQSADAMQCRGGAVSGIPSCPDPPPTTAEPECDWECKEAYRRQVREWKKYKAERKRQKAIYNQQLREYKERQSIVNRANALIGRANEARRAGRYQQELTLLQQAMALVPDEPKFRYNVVAHLAYHGMNAARLAYARGEYSSINALWADYRELFRLNSADLSSLPNYATIKSQADDFAYSIFLLKEASARADQARRIAGQEQAAADARERQARIDAEGRDRQARIDARRARETSRESRVVATPHDSRVTQLNPAARTAEAAAEASGPARQGLPPPGSTLDRLEGLTNGMTTGRGIDGGNSQMDSRATAPPSAAVPAAVRVISAADLARYNRAPEFREANGMLERTQTARKAAETRRREVARQADLARGGLAPPPSAAEINEAERAARLARNQEQAAENAREAVINRIEKGHIIMVPDE